MTRLFNLESYLECCQYARLFDESPDNLIPPDGNNPRAYKAFLQKHAHHPYLNSPILDANSRPQSLLVGWAPPTSQVGWALPTTNQGDKQRLFIIRDTVDLMTLSMSNLLEYRDGYLYSSAYHYWNHFSEISQLKLTKPLVFVDLDSFEIQRLIPLSFIQPDNSPYQIPILDTRNPIILESVYNPAETYNNICRDLATRILQNQFPRLANSDETITHLSHYLQKISFFQKIQPYIAHETLTFIVEILCQGEIFYKQVTLAVATLADVISASINTPALRKLATKHPDYQFVLISQYNILNIQRVLPNYICLSPICQEFGEIWAAKNQLNFPLFGIYLDGIEFAINISRSRQWIQLSSRLEDAISYEGKLRILQGRIPDTNQSDFRIPQGSQTASLPIRVNGNDYCIDNMPQDYSITIQNYQGTEDVRVFIEFHLQPGSFPDLRVIDLQGKYKITTALRERQTVDIPITHIPPEEINRTRHEKSSTQIDRLINCINVNINDINVVEQLRSDLSQLSEKLNNTNRGIRNYRTLGELLNNAAQLHVTNIRPAPLQFVNASANEPLVTDLISVFQPERLNGIVDLIVALLQSSELSENGQRLLYNAIIFIGKTYNFSINLSVERLFSQDLINNARGQRGNPSNEYLQCLARIATREPLQKQYFEWLDSYYTETKYMWGYGRILVWYYDFDSPNEILNYRYHFNKLLQHLLHQAPSTLNAEYKQNTFLALLYLLTFRAKERDFCQDGSEERELAERVIERFQQSPIRLNQVSTEKSLNQFFQEMIEGTITETDVDRLLGAD